MFFLVLVVAVVVVAANLWERTLSLLLGMLVVMLNNPVMLNNLVILHNNLVILNNNLVILHNNPNMHNLILLREHIPRPTLRVVPLEVNNNRLLMHRLIHSP
jgi:hypothetical protein